MGECRHRRRWEAGRQGGAGARGAPIDPAAPLPPHPPARSNCRARLQQHNSRRRKALPAVGPALRDAKRSRGGGVWNFPALPSVAPSTALPWPAALGLQAGGSAAVPLPPLPGLALPLPSLPRGLSVPLPPLPAAAMFGPPSHSQPGTLPLAATPAAGAAAARQEPARDLAALQHLARLQAMQVRALLAPQVRRQRMPRACGARGTRMPRSLSCG